MLYFSTMKDSHEHEQYGLTPADWEAFETIKLTERYRGYAPDAGPLHILGVEALLRNDETNARRYAELEHTYIHKEMQTVKRFAIMVAEQNYNRLAIPPSLKPTDTLLLVISNACQQCNLLTTALELFQSAQVPLMIVMQTAETEADIQRFANDNRLPDNPALYLYPASERPMGLEDDESLYRISTSGRPLCVVGSCLQR